MSGHSEINGGAAFGRWARKHMGWLIGAVTAVGTGVGLLTGSRLEFGGERLTKHEERLDNHDARIESLERVMVRELRILVALGCNNPSTPNEMFDLLDCRARLNRVGVEPAPGRPR